MPTFNYSFIDHRGAKKYSTIEGATLHEAEINLDVRGIAYLEISEEGSGKTISPKTSKIRGKVTRRELIEFCIYMGTLSEAGLSLIVALSEFANETQNLMLKHVVETLRSNVENGKMLSDVMAQFPKVFTKEFVHLIRAGERTGTLPNSFKELRSYLEWLERVSGDIKQATTYPIFVSVALAVFVLYLFSSVIPKITTILIDMKLKLPLITKIIVFLSDIAIHSWYYWVAGGIITPLLFKFLLRKNQKFAIFIDQIKLKIPIFGTLIQLIVQARFTQNFSILHRAGVSILENLELCKGFIGNLLFEKALLKASQDVQEGINLSVSLKNSGLFTGLVIRMFAVGEASGDLENSLKHAANYYDEEVPRRVKRVFGLLEPIIILFLVGIIGVIALAIFLPILSISGGMRS
jgi:type IV pilus assembly protein PilC